MLAFGYEGSTPSVHTTPIETEDEQCQACELALSMSGRFYCFCPKASDAGRYDPGSKSGG